MFFIMGISRGEKKLPFVKTMVCSACGKFGRLEAYMTYTYFTLFFIPLFRWNTEYFVMSSCCGTVYSIEKSLGKRIQKGEEVILKDEDLIHRTAHSNFAGPSYENEDITRCPSCGYTTKEDFLYCPKCGRRL